MYNPIQTVGRTADTVSYLEFIEDVLEPTGPLVYRRNAELPQQVGGKAPLSVLFNCSDAYWHSVFDQLSASCRAIILIPQTTAGVLEEIGRIREAGLFEKTILFIPSSGQVHKGEKLWNETALELAKNGCRLPAYQNNGAAFIPT